MKYAVVMRSGAMIYVPIGSGIQKLIGEGIHRNTDSMLIA
jgi:hypothetical protein